MRPGRLMLTWLRFMDENKKLPQPPEGSKYEIYKNE
jgi:hypothetical protein